MKKSFTEHTIGFLGIAISIFLLANYTSFISEIIGYLEKSFSSDGILSNKAINLIHMVYFFMIITTSFLSISVILNYDKKFFRSIGRFFQFEERQSNNIYLPKYFDLIILITGTIAAFLQIIMLVFFGETTNLNDDYRGEGPLEKIFAIIIFISLLLIIISIRKVKIIINPTLKKKITLILLILFSIFLFFYLGEELSWGQRIFEIESFGVFQEHNLQNETNLHNFVKPEILVGILYPLVSSLVFVSFIILWIFWQDRKDQIFDLLLPHPNLFFVVLAMVVISFFGGGGETFEQLLTLAIFFYSLRLFMCMRYYFKTRTTT